MILGNVSVVRVLFLVCLKAMSHILPSFHIFPLSPNVLALSRYKNQKASINKEAERAKGFFSNTFVISKEGSKAVDEVKFLLLVNAQGHTYTPTNATGSPNVENVPYELGIWVLETEQGIEFQMYVAFSSVYFFYEYS